MGTPAPVGIDAAASGRPVRVGMWASSRSKGKRRERASRQASNQRACPSEFSPVSSGTSPPVAAARARASASRAYGAAAGISRRRRSEEHTSELQSRGQLVCRLLLEKKKQRQI